MVYVIQSLHDKQKLLDVFFEDLARFKFGRHHLPPEGGQQPLQWDDYGHQVGVRLSFLTYVLTHSFLTLTFEQASKLWDTFYTQVPPAPAPAGTPSVSGAREVPGCLRGCMHQHVIRLQGMSCMHHMYHA